MLIIKSPVFQAIQQQLFLLNLRHIFFVLNTQHVNKYGDFHWC